MWIIISPVKYLGVFGQLKRGAGDAIAGHQRVGGGLPRVRSAMAGRYNPHRSRRRRPRPFRSQEQDRVSPVKQILT